MGYENVDPVALWGAGLSTIIAIVGFFRWWLDGPRLSVHVFNPREYWLGENIFGFAISNCGNQPTVVQKVEVRFLSGRGRKAEEIGRATFDQSTTWDPSSKSVPDPHKPDNTTREPRILQKGDELHGANRAVAGYNSSKHWIRVSAFPRDSSKAFRGWAAPTSREEAS